MTNCCKHITWFFFCTLFFSLVGEALPKFYSQSGQDKYLYERFFKNKRNGIFVEIGAHDGITKSNSYFFEKYLGWSGICIEPISELFELLEKNRSCTCIKGCIANFTGTAEFLKISGYSEMLSGLSSHYDERHLERIEKELQLYGGSKATIQVPCYKLVDIFKTHGISHVDYLSVDTEGSELAVLQSIDFEVIDISIIGVENNYNTQEARKFLTKKGYAYLTKLGGDEFYIKK